MKKALTLLLFLFTITVLGAHNLTIRFDDCTIEEALGQLKNEGISFLIKSDSIDMSAKVNASFTDAPLEIIVSTVFKDQNVKIIVNDNTVVISKKTEPAHTEHKKAREINTTGRITDRQGIPIPGASIFIQETSIGTISDSEGNFSLSLENEVILVVSCLS